MALPDVVFVTAVYPGPEGLSEQDTVHFQHLYSAVQPLVCFTDTTDNTVCAPTCIHLPRDQLQSFQQTEAVLPQLRNTEKDTLLHFQRGNAKAELLWRASQVQKATLGYVWLDFDILKISNNKERFLKRLTNFAESFQVVPEKVIAPGCLKADQINWNHLFAFPIWRFCGGLLLVPTGLVERFNALHNEQLAKCKQLGATTWEINLWAAMEHQNEGLFHWYSADHNDSIIEAPQKQRQKKLIYLSMIKNESRIIRRSIEAALPIVDAVCICDTGSTDNTLEILEETYKTMSIPGKTFSGETYAWKNFGHNRSLSFQCAVEMCKELEWDPEHTYAVLLDADMRLKPQSKFDKQVLTAIGYKIIQKSGSLEYYNTRFVKLSHPWKCVGVTHEYWDGGNTDTLTQDVVFIDDVGDGGCKADKFERDVRLLEQGLKDEPNNPRYFFYLAQSYKDNKQLDKAIEYYKKRIDAGGWYEEIWYSMYTLCKLYGEKGMAADMEYWGLKAYEFRKERSENILFMTRWFKDRRQYWKAWHYWELGSRITKPNDLLFLETDCYEKAFDLERTILHDYVFPHKKQESLDYSLAAFNKWGEGFCYSNIQWFVQRIRCQVRKLEFQDIGDFVATSTCIVPLKSGQYRLNVRYVNYRIQPNGGYVMSLNGVVNGDNPVITENYTCLMDANMNILSSLERMEMKDQPRNVNARIRGLEDVRIWRPSADSDELRYIATTSDHSYDGKIRQHTGIYNLATHTYDQSKSLKPPMPTDCEKNWIPYKGDKYIYGWCPFRIGSLKDDQLIIEKQQETPRLLSHMRGSSTLVEEGGFWWGLTHCVIYQQPRKYYHMVVKIDAATDRLVGYTDPFFFCNNAIEYCLGFLKKGGSYTAIVSQNDRHPIMATFEDKDLRWKTVS